MFAPAVRQQQLTTAAARFVAQCNILARGGAWCSMSVTFNLVAAAVAPSLGRFRDRQPMDARQHESLPSLRGNGLHFLDQRPLELCTRSRAFGIDRERSDRISCVDHGGTMAPACPVIERQTARDGMGPRLHFRAAGEARGLDAC